MAKGNKFNAEKFNAPFAMNLRKLMDNGGVTQDELSKVVGKTRQTVSQYVNGVSEPGYETLVKIADYFDISADYLLGRTVDPSRKPTATEELGLSPTAISKIMWQKKINADGFDAMAALSHLLENDDIWNLLFSIGDYADAVKAELICETIMKQQANASGVIDIDAAILKLREKAEEYSKINISIHDYLIANAHSLSSNIELCDTLGYIGPYDVKLTDLCSFKLNQMLSGILRDIQKECCHGND